MRRLSCPRPPLVRFAAVSLDRGAGGIAELSRQVYRALLGMEQGGRIRLEVQVLEGIGPAPDDDLAGSAGTELARWFGGNRRRFALAFVAAGADIRLVDHVGLARIPALLPRFVMNDYIALIHGVEIWNSTRWDYLRAARKARSLIANSHYTARKAREYCPDLPEIRVCWPGKDEFRITPLPPKLEQPWEPLGRHALLIVGRLAAAQRHKGHDQLIEAMPLVLRQVPDAQLVIAGGGDDRERLQAKAREFGVVQQVRFTGWLSEEQLGMLYTRCAAFVMPSDGDGFGFVFLEAMMRGLPCVGLASGAAAEIFGDGKSGILVDREDREAMAAQLASLLRDEHRRKRLGLAGRSRYESMFTGQHFARRFEAVLLGDGSEEAERCA